MPVRKVIKETDNYMMRCWQQVIAATSTAMRWAVHRRKLCDGNQPQRFQNIKNFTLIAYHFYTNRTCTNADYPFPFFGHSHSKRHERNWSTADRWQEEIETITNAQNFEKKNCELISLILRRTQIFLVAKQPKDVLSLENIFLPSAQMDDISNYYSSFLPSLH